MDISSLTIEQLKAIAYDEIVKLEIAKNNLVMIKNRIDELSNKEVETNGLDKKNK